MQAESIYDCAPHFVHLHYEFTGKERDVESGLDYFGARYYASTMGRFMSPDTFGEHIEDPQTLNRYSYVGNNPLSRTDPDGHDFYLGCTIAKDGSNSSTCRHAHKFSGPAVNLRLGSGNEPNLRNVHSGEYYPGVQHTVCDWMGLC